VPGKYVAGTMAPAGAALDRPGVQYIVRLVPKSDTTPFSQRLAALADNLRPVARYSLTHFREKT
jgi:hypothetical protein